MLYIVAVYIYMLYDEDHHILYCIYKFISTPTTTINATPTTATAAINTTLHRGVLADQYGEFMVQEDRSHSKETLQEDFNAR